MPHRLLMHQRLLIFIAVHAMIAVVLTFVAFADEPANRPIREEVWALPMTLPTIAYVVRPVGDGPFPLVIMNHGVSLNQRERSFFPLVEFRDAAMWFARRGYMVVAPSGSGYGAAALDDPEHGIYSVFYSKIGSCDNPNFRDAGFAVALIDKWIIDYMTEQKLIVPDKTIVVGQSAGGWAGLALSSQNLPAVRTARTPMLWIYVENDTFFGPALSNRMHQAYTAAGGSAEYHLLPPFGSDGHFLIDSPEAVPLWAPLVAAFLDNHE